MGKTPDQVSSEILAKLAVTAPGFSLALGTPERKIVDAVGEAVSEAYIDQYLVGSLLDIESKAGLELEQWTAVFGFGRLQGRKATGVVRVQLATANLQNISIPLGSQFYTRQTQSTTGTPLYFTSTQVIIIPAGALVVDIPVECTVVGVGGNVPPDSIVYLGQVLGASSVTNLQAFNGGVDVETDEELRQRFKDTLLRNIAGTEDWYLGLAYQNKNVSKAAVFGPITKYVTQIAVPSTSFTLPVTNDVKYAWPDGDTIFKNLGQDDETFYRPIDDYTFASGTTPAVTRVSGGAMVVGDIIDVEFDYTTRSSRNDPPNGITNKVDMFVNGTDPYTITERTVLTATYLSATTSSSFYTGNFARVGTTGSPSTANRFMRLGSVPVVSFPSSITVGVTNYQQGTHYHLLRGTTLVAGSVRESAGIEWLPSPTGPPDNTAMTLSYVYNRVPEVLGAIVKTNKQITTDVLVHQASYQYLKVFLSMEFNRGYVVSQVTNAVRERLQSYFGGLPYGAWVEFSDLCLAVHQVLGVDNVYVTTSSDDAVNYGVQVFGNSTDVTPSATQTVDFKLNDNQLPIFLSAVILRKANR